MKSSSRLTSTNGRNLTPGAARHPETRTDVCQNKGNLASVSGNGRSDAPRLFGLWIYRDRDGSVVSAVSYRCHLLRRLGRILSHPMEHAALGKFLARALAADISMAAAHSAKSAGL